MTACKRLYWANSFFTAADRDFNLQCAKTLRAAGYEVFLPQETSTNAEASPPPQEIFREDTAALLSSDLMVACLDQETIDSGVACEIGIAYAHGLPIIGIYTDIRQYRIGPGKMYKNLYVIGAIERLNNIVSSVGSLVDLLKEHFKQAEIPGAGDINDSALASAEYDNFVDELESWYEPPWSTKVIAERWLRESPGAHLVDMGCGPGRLAKAIRDLNIDIAYYGWDPSSGMIAEAKRQELGDKFHFTSSLSEINEIASVKPFDIAMLGFVLHDHKQRDEIIDQCSRLVKRGGNIIIVDLFSGDLPSLTSLLKRSLAMPLDCPDSRITPKWVREACSSLGFHLADCRLDILNIQFPSQGGLSRYLQFFGIDRGMDLPLCIARGATAWREQIAAAVSSIQVPFRDIRVFVSCILEKI
jgi:nucleoside 2-deoxyribosyltransferase/ubiquinone/menaquinone biosynthesis C-methylase UbiE